MEELGILHIFSKGTCSVKGQGKRKDFVNYRLVGKQPVFYEETGEPKRIVITPELEQKLRGDVMDNNCQMVIFSDRAYNAIIRETFEWEPVETGGILLGHVLDNGCWLVMDVLPPGYGENREGDNVHHEYGYFEYNQRFVNYLAKSVAEQYKIPLELLGLWHRHPGSMDVFSGTDDTTNRSFALQSKYGAISGLVNVDPQFRVTMYYIPHSEGETAGRPGYKEVDVEVISTEDIPKIYRRLRYYDGSEASLHPYFSKGEQQGKKEVIAMPNDSMPSLVKWFNKIRKKIRKG